MREGGVESVASSEVDGDLEQVVLQDNETGVDDGSVTQDRLEAGELLDSVHLATGDTPVVGVERRGCGARPDDGAEAHRVGDRTYAVICACGEPSERGDG